MIIGLHGKAKSGKDESFKQLEAIGKSEGIRFKRVAFADPLKEAALDSIGVTANLDPDTLKDDCSITIYKNQAPQRTISGRQYLQNFGVAAREVYGSNFWVDLSMSRINLTGNIVFTDVRFINEAEAIRNAGGYILYVYRVEDEPDGDHISEQKLPDDLIDFYIDNTEDIANLKVNLKNTLNDILYDQKEYEDELFDNERARTPRESERWN